MSICSIIAKAKNRLFPQKQLGLSEYVSRHPSRFGYWMRPANDLQSQKMVGAYLSAIKDELKNGGYIFVKKSRAADLFRQLTELEASFKPIHIPVMADLHEILDFEDPKELWVIVEDDSLPYETLASRFKVAEVIIRKNIAPQLGVPIESSKATKEYFEKQKSRGYTLMMFIEMDYPSIKGFSVIQSQCRSLKIATCRITRESEHDRSLHAIFNEAEHSEDELKSRSANTIRIYGSGPKYQTEIRRDLSRVIQYYAQSANTQQGSSVIHEAYTVDPAELLINSNLGLVFGLEDAQIVDLDR